MRFGLAVFAAVCACGGNRPALYPAGTDRDEGHGLLARASTQFLTDDERDDGLFDDAPRRRPYGGSGYGGSGYGGASYAGFVVPAWAVTAPVRTPKYNQTPGLTGAIEGTVALRPAPTRCGVAAPAVVYIEKVQVGRVLMNEGRPASVGGTLVKRGCALAPAVQIVTPLPAALAIHGDAKPARLRVGAQAFELQPAGRVAIQLAAGVTRVDVEGGGAAWILALDTPAYAITDDRGRFRLDELAAGTYEVTIWRAGKLEPALVKRTVKVEHHRTARLDVR